METKNLAARAIIFDLDGTLWDTVSVCAHAYNQAITLSGRDYRRITDEDVRSSMGLSADEFRAKIFPDLSREDGTALLRKCFEQEIAEISRRGAKFFDGVLEGLPKLARERDLYIVSNCDPAYLQTFYNISGLKNCFKDAECHGATGLSKGENIRLVLQRNSIKSAVYVGDARGDQLAADFAGLPFVYARYGFGQCDRFDTAIDSFSELESWIARLI